MHFVTSLLVGIVLLDGCKRFESVYESFALGIVIKTSQLLRKLLSIGNVVIEACEPNKVGYTRCLGTTDPPCAACLEQLFHVAQLARKCFF